MIHQEHRQASSVYLGREIEGGHDRVERQPGCHPLEPLTQLDLERGVEVQGETGPEGAMGDWGEF